MFLRARAEENPGTQELFLYNQEQIVLRKMLECVVIAKDLAYRGRVNAATIENDAWCVEKQGVFSVIRDGDLDIYKILGRSWKNGEKVYHRN